MIKVISVEKKKKYYLVSTTKSDYKFEEDIIVKYNVFNNTEFDDAEFEKIIQDANKVSAYNKVLRYLAYGPRSRNEIAHFLKEREISNIKEILDRLEYDGYINDEKVAYCVLDYYKEAKKGPLYIARKMKEKMLDDSIISKTIEEYSNEEAIANAKKVLEKLAPTIKSYPIKKQKEKLYSSLVSKGYSIDISLKVIDEIILVDESDERLAKEIENLKAKADRKALTGKEKDQFIIEHLLAKGYNYSKVKDALK